MAEEERAWRYNNNGKHGWKRKEQRLGERGAAKDVLMLLLATVLLEMWRDTLITISICTVYFENSL